MASEDVIDGNVIRATYWSVAELADAAERRVDRSRVESSGMSDPGFAGCLFDEAIELARTGWTDQLDTALELAESAVTMCEKEHEMDTFTAEWGYSGADVDVDRYLQGIPENMIDYPLSTTSKVGRVITLCNSMSFSSAISAGTIKRRGYLITALVFALAELGHATEIWADMSSSAYLAAPYARTRVLVKGPNDALDPAQIMFMFAHPAARRQLGFATCHAFPGEFTRLRDSGIRTAEPPERDLPDGAIYLPELLSNKDHPNIQEELKDYLRELELITD